MTRQLAFSRLANVDEEFCREREVECIPSLPGSKLGFAIGTQGKSPINGLRHPPEADTNGWYIWCGEEFSSDAGFFSPLHIEHLSVRCPEVLKLLGLPPGYRFLLAGGYLDVWFDPDLDRSSGRGPLYPDDTPTLQEKNGRALFKRG